MNTSLLLHVRFIICDEKLGLVNFWWYFKEEKANSNIYAATAHVPFSNQMRFVLARRLFCKTFVDISDFKM